MIQKNFWEYKKLHEMTRTEWEQLCDGCAKCCLNKLEDEETGIVYGTNVVCQYLDPDTCQCKQYSTRSIMVPECITLTADNIDQVYFMPSSCSYRLLAEGKSLPAWHPLLSNDKELSDNKGLNEHGKEKSVHDSGHSVRGKVISELEVDDLMHHLTGEWD